jgi:hypothetical protein
MTRVIIHNHLPRRRTRDYAEPKGILSAHPHLPSEEGREWYARLSSAAQAKPTDPKGGVSGWSKEALSHYARGMDAITERDLKDDEPRIVSGVRGMQSKSFSKRFSNQAAMERWMSSPEAGDYEVQRVERA